MKSKINAVFSFPNYYSSTVSNQITFPSGRFLKVSSFDYSIKSLFQIKQVPEKFRENMTQVSTSNNKII
jgi:hypothetical protein